MKEGASENANKMLDEITNENPFLAAKLTSRTGIAELPGFFGIGDENEADDYAGFAQPVCQDTDAAIVWLKKQIVKYTKPQGILPVQAGFRHKGYSGCHTVKKNR